MLMDLVVEASIYNFKSNNNQKTMNKIRISNTKNTNTCYCCQRLSSYLIYLSHRYLVLVLGF